MIHICPQSQLAQTLETSGASHVISLLSMNADFERPPGLFPANHLCLAMHDVAEERPGLMAPAIEHVEAILDFARACDRDAPLVVHCYAGISRSTAAGYAIAAALTPERDEAELALMLRARAPSATPNNLIVAHADRLLRRDGRMVRAIRAIGRGAEAFEGTSFCLPVAAGLGRRPAPRYGP